MSVINTLTEGIRQRSLANEGEALLGKWERTGLLEGLDDVKRIEHGSSSRKPGCSTSERDNHHASR